MREVLHYQFLCNEMDYTFECKHLDQVILDRFMSVSSYSIRKILPSENIFMFNGRPVVASAVADVLHNSSGSTAHESGSELNADFLVRLGRKWDMLLKGKFTRKVFENEDTRRILQNSLSLAFLDVCEYLYDDCFIKRLNDGIHIYSKRGVLK